ncbi:MAG: hypothetical protein WBR26_27970 [Candidatus Acidiferrum sp.]
MKTRTIVVTLILALLAWLPATAQQGTTNPATPQVQAPSAPADSGTAPGKSGCACCDQMKNQDKGTQASNTMSCCHGKNATCCKSDSKDAQTAMNCCAGKSGKQCAAKNGKACCGKDATACNAKNGKDCCAAGEGCCHKASQA